MYKIMYYNEYINDLGHLVKGFKILITSDKNTINWYKKNDSTATIEKIK